MPVRRASAASTSASADAARLEHDQQVIEQVGGLRDQPLAVLGDRRERGLDRLLAELLGAMRHALVEQLARIGRLGARLRALVHAARPGRAG